MSEELIKQLVMSKIKSIISSEKIGDEKPTDTINRLLKDVNIDAIAPALEQQNVPSEVPQQQPTALVEIPNVTNPPQKGNPPVRDFNQSPIPIQNIEPVKNVEPPQPVEPSYQLRTQSDLENEFGSRWRQLTGWPVFRGDHLLGYKPDDDASQKELHRIWTATGENGYGAIQIKGQYVPVFRKMIQKIS